MNTKPTSKAITLKDKLKSIEKKKEILETIDFNKLSFTKKPGDKLLFESHRPIQGIGYIIYCDGTIVFYSKVKKSNVFRMPKALQKWIQFPEKDFHPLQLEADFYYKEEKEMKRIENVSITLINKRTNNYFSYFIYPLRFSSKKNQIETILDTKEVGFWRISSEKIREYFDYTERFKESSFILQNTNLPTVLNDHELIVKGKIRKTIFEIYSLPINQIVIKIKTVMKNDGSFALPYAIKEYIENWLEKNEYILCSLNNETPIVLKSKIRTAGSVRIKELIFDYYGEYKEIKLLITNNNWKLTEKALFEKQLRGFLIESNFEVEMVRNDIQSTKTHYKKKIAKQLKEIIFKAFSNENAIITYETKVITKHFPGENKIGEIRIFDSLVLIRNKEIKKSLLLLIELKSSICSVKSSIIKEAIGNLLHFKRKLGNSDRIVPIVIYPTKWSLDNTSETKRFGEEIGVLLIEENEINELVLEPKKLVNKLYNFVEKTNDRKEKRYLDDSLSHYIKSLTIMENNCLKNSDIQLLKKYERLLLDTFPANTKIVKKDLKQHKGSVFEQQIKERLEKNGYEVIDNLVLEVHYKTFEIDLLGLKDGEVLIAECRDGNHLSKRKDIDSQIKTKIYKTELMKFLFNTQKAVVYFKVNNFTEEMYNKYQQTNWVKNFKIVIF